MQGFLENWILFRFYPILPILSVVQEMASKDRCSVHPKNLCLWSASCGKSFTSPPSTAHPNLFARILLHEIVWLTCS